MEYGPKDEEERNEIIKMIGEYFLETGDSVRKISEHFSKSNLKISKTTVSKYIKEYQKMNHDKQEQIQQYIDKNTSKSIQDKNVKVRVFKVAKLSIDGYSIEEIANLLGETRSTIEKDISIRLKQLALENANIDKLYKVVLDNLKRHRIDALDNDKQFGKNNG